LECPEIDQLALRAILEEVLSQYDVQPMSTALVPVSNINDRVMIYLATKKLDGLSKNTIYNYQLHLMRFATFMSKNVEEITTLDIRMYLSAIMKKFILKNSTIATETSILKSFFSWLENEGYIDKSPLRKIKQIKTEKRLRKAMTIDEVERLRDGCKTQRQTALFEFMYSTGCRLSEIVGVNIQNINWNENSLKVVGKGNKERVVYFSSKAKLEIRKYIGTRINSFETQPLFITERKPYRRLGNRAIQKEIKKIAIHAHFDTPVFPHLLRHTMATLSLQSGVPLPVIQKILGHTPCNHSDIRFTQ
jgi:integrase/recombinase XerD